MGGRSRSANETAAVNTDIEPKRMDSIANELERVHADTRRRAYELFQTRGPHIGSALADWLTAERELVSEPALETSRKSLRGKRCLTRLLYPCPYHMQQGTPR